MFATPAATSGVNSRRERLACRTMLSFDDWFAAKHAAIPLASAQAVLALSAGGATLPFIARYRK